MVKVCTQGLMTTTHVHKQAGHHHHLENEIQPRFSYQQTDVKGYRAGIECQDVGVLHQRQAQGTELIAQLLRNVVTVTFLHPGIETLEVGSHLFLLAGIVAIEIQEGLPPEVAFPGQTMENLTLLLEVIQFTAGLSLQEEQVDVAVIIGQRTLLAMAHRT